MTKVTAAKQAAALVYARFGAPSNGTPVVAGTFEENAQVMKECCEASPGSALRCYEAILNSLR